MAVKIRCKRMGNKNRPFFRLVVADSRFPRDGRFLEILGHYDPLKEPAAIKIDRESALKWLERGAQVSETARSLLKKTGIYQEFQNIKAERKKSKKGVREEQPAADTPVEVISATLEEVTESVPLEEAVAEAPLEEVVAEAPLEEVVAETPVEGFIAETLVEEVIEAASVQEPAETESEATDENTE